MNQDDCGVHSVLESWPGSQRSEPGLPAGPVSSCSLVGRAQEVGETVQSLTSVPKTHAIPSPVTVLCPSCPSLYRNWSQTLYPLCQVAHPCSPTQLCPWTLPGPICHCVFEDGIVWLLADSVTGLQASMGRTYNCLLLSDLLRVCSAPLISLLCHHAGAGSARLPHKP